MQILLIEPDVVLANTYCDTFRRLGYRVDHERNAAAAIATADVCRPDMVIMELQLAAHSGAAFLYEFRSYTDWQHIPIIVHTLLPPDALAVFEQTFHELGVKDVLYKPQTTLRRLVDCVQKHVVSGV